MIEVPTFADLNLAAILPVLTLGLGSTLLVLIDVFLPKDRKYLTAWLALAGIVVSFILTLFSFNVENTSALADMYVADNFSAYLNMTVLLAAFLTILLGRDYLVKRDMERGEYYVLLLLSTTGAMLMGSANDLIAVFVALELLSIPLYVLAAFRLDNAKSEESGIKYFILGAFASAFFVYGAALVYGATGTTNLVEIFDSVAYIVETGSSSMWFLLIGVALLVVGFGFKVAIVPFHMWTPDVYEGAPTPVTAYMSVAAKIGGFAALIRVMTIALPLVVIGDSPFAVWQTTVTVLAALTLIVGNFVAISQTNLKRMLAYSSIAHAGYILMAVAAAGTPGVANSAAQAALVYLLTYTLTNLGAFAVVMAIEKEDGSGTELDDISGLSQSKPLMAVIMAVFMLSLTGIPLTGGFIGKWFVFQATLNAGLVALAVLGVITSVVSAFYYVRVIVNMYLVDADGDEAEGATPMVNWALYATFAGTLIIGILPMLVVNLAETVNLAVAILP